MREARHGGALSVAAQAIEGLRAKVKEMEAAVKEAEAHCGSCPRIKALEEALAAAVEALMDDLLWEDDPSGQYDVLAEAFYGETGLMAPGKAMPLEMTYTQAREAERDQAWSDFKKKRHGEAVARKRAALTAVAIPASLLAAAATYRKARRG